MGDFNSDESVCTLINRTSGPLEVRFNGRTFTLKPGKNYGVPREMVSYAKSQNVLMGSENPLNPRQFVSLVGVDGGKDDCSPIKQSNAVERMDRSRARGQGRRAKPIEGDEPSPFEARMRDSEDESEFADAVRATRPDA